MVTIPGLIDNAASLARAARRSADAELEAAEESARKAKRAAVGPRNASKAAPADAGLRATADAAAEAATKAGRVVESVRKAGDQKVADAQREVERLRFEHACDVWIYRTSVPADECPVGLFDPLLWELSGHDDYVAAALHLQRDGTSIPEGWTSPSGVSLASQRHQRPPSPDPS